MHITRTLPWMKTLQIRNVPDDVHRELRSLAAAAGLPLSDYLLHEVTRIAGRRSVGEVLRRAAARPGGASSEAIMETMRVIREDR